jgi:hypothetical protein
MDHFKALTMPSSPAQKTNREIERHYFERFCEAYELPAGTISFADKPDVLVTGNRTVGIEITNFYLEPGSDETSEQRQRCRRYEVASEAHRLYLAYGGKDIELTIEFAPTKPITSATRKTLPKKLAQFAARIETQPMGAYYPDSFPDMPEIASIWSSGREWPNPTWVRPGQVYSYEEMSAAKLREIVAQKESKAADYVPCEAYWLLIVVDWADAAQDQEITTLGLKLASDVYEKIIIYKPGFEEIVEVKS